MKKTLGLGAIVMMQALGCSSGDGTPVPSDIPLNELAEPLAGAICAGMESCAPLYVPNACVARMTLLASASMVPALNAAVESGTIVYHGTEAEQCLADLSHTCMFDGEESPDSCLGNFVHNCVFDGAVFPVSCLAMAEGTVAAGWPCSIDAECAEGLHCAGATCPGACKARSGVGAACLGEDDCTPGLGCANGLCVTRLPQGSVCAGGDNECERGLFCRSLEGAATWTCVPMTAVMTGAENAPCIFGFAATQSLCKAGLSCVFTDNDVTKGGFCKPQVASGAACGVALPTQCPGEEVCVSGVCGAAPAVGSPCAPDVFDTCAVGATCDDGSSPVGKCVALTSNGAACSTDEACVSGNCYSWKCAPDQDCDEPY